MKIKLFECCMPVKGARRSVICDVQRNNYEFIPNSLYDFITRYDGHSVEEIKADFPADAHETIDEYISFLINKEFAFFTKYPEYYPPISKQWEMPYEITNCIVDIDSTSGHDYEKIFSQLDELGCIAVEIRCFDTIPCAQLITILESVNNTMVRSIDLLLTYDEQYCNAATLQHIQDTYKRVVTIVLHSCPSDLDVSAFPPLVMGTDKVIPNSTCCGTINKLNFSCNQKKFLEALSFNSCLNRKISIDTNGDIKNCPSMQQSYGNIADTTLAQALADKTFKDIWSITKDQVTTCKSCEFRYICTDCRAYRQDEADIYSKPAKCGYDPFQAEWMGNYELSQTSISI